MTDYETAYRALREGLEALVAKAQGRVAMPGNFKSEPLRNYVLVSEVAALLAPSPAEGTGEADVLRVALDWLADQMRAETGSDGWAESALIEARRDLAAPAPVSSGEAGDPERFIATRAGLCGECRRAFAAGDLIVGGGGWFAHPECAPVVTPSAEDGA